MFKTGIEEVKEDHEALQKQMDANDREVTLSLSSVTLSPFCHPVTLLSPCHVTLSRSYSVTLSLCHQDPVTAKECFLNHLLRYK
eukprot:1363502-Amorphochlora_amoeboformis.AAC.1